MRNGNGAIIEVHVGGARNSQVIARAVAAKMREEAPTSFSHVALVAGRTAPMEERFFQTLHRELDRNGGLTILPDRRNREAWHRALDGTSSLVLPNAENLSEVQQRAIFLALAEQRNRFIYTIANMPPSDLVRRGQWIAAFKALFTPCVVHQTLGRTHGNGRPSRAQVRA